MAVEVIKSFVTACPGLLHDTIISDPTFVAELIQIINNDTTTSFFFDVALTPPEITTLDDLLATWSCPGFLISDVVSLGDAGGIILPIVFNTESKAKNKWLSHEGDNSLSSDDTPAIIPFNCKLVGVTFCNEEEKVDTDIEIYQTMKNDNVRNKISTWQIRSARTGHKTNLIEMVFTAGDKIGVYLRDAGAEPEKVIVIIYVQIYELLKEENTESFTT